MESVIPKLIMLVDDGIVEKEEMVQELLNFISEEDAQKLYDNLMEYLGEN